MTIETELKLRSSAQCELCGAVENLQVYHVPPYLNGSADQSLLICHTCCEHIEKPGAIDPQYWTCLKDSMWSQVPAVQVIVWRILNQLNTENWAQSLLEMLYLDETTLAFAQSTHDSDVLVDLKHIDSNGVVLEAGDTVVILKDLNVKGTSFVAKRGTVVRGISLIMDNPEQIEGRINGQQIVILTKFVKKA